MRVQVIPSRAARAGSTSEWPPRPARRWFPTARSLSQPRLARGPRAVRPGCEQLDYKADTDPWRECVLKLAHRDDRYNRYPISTNCVGHRGFMQCTTF
jgi:hypothetical protein